MALPRESNYDRMCRQVRQDFLRYDQARMIEKFHLDWDPTYLYLPFCGQPYRIHRRTGAVEWGENGFAVTHGAGYNAVMSIYDALSRTEGACRLAGRFTPVGSLPGTGLFSRAGSDFFAPVARAFTHRAGQVARACESLGGVPEGRGDAAYRLMVFPFLPVLLQFYDADEEFPASVQLLWDENVLDFVRFETTFFIASHLFQRIQEEMDRLSRPGEEPDAQTK